MRPLKHGPFQNFPQIAAGGLIRGGHRLAIKPQWTMRLPAAGLSLQKRRFLSFPLNDSQSLASIGINPTETHRGENYRFISGPLLTGTNGVPKRKLL